MSFKTIPQVYKDVSLEELDNGKEIYEDEE